MGGSRILATIRIDFDETFSPVVKPATVRTILSLALSNGWPIHQLDFKNTFLHGHLDETAYCQQLPGFVSAKFLNHVCRLNKALYGLKQAPRAWFQRFASHVQHLGFKGCKSDPSLFVYNTCMNQAHLLVYIDDIILTASSPGFLASIITALSREFAMTDLGSLHYFLGVAVSKRDGGLHLCQERYAKEILEKASMTNCKPSRTPVDTNLKLGHDVGPTFYDPTLFRSLAGALQYLTFTRSDISYVVQPCSLHMHDLRERHFTALKRILRYIKGTAHLGLLLQLGPIEQLTAYSVQIGRDARIQDAQHPIIACISATIWSHGLPSAKQRSLVQALKPSIVPSPTP